VGVIKQMNAWLLYQQRFSFVIAYNHRHDLFEFLTKTLFDPEEFETALLLSVHGKHLEMELYENALQTGGI